MQLYKLHIHDKDEKETYLSAEELANKYNLMIRGGRKPSSNRAASAIKKYLQRNKINFEDIYTKGYGNTLTKVYPSSIYIPAMKEFFEINYGITDLKDVYSKGPFII